MNMQAYKADTARNRGIPCIFFKIIIQLYLLSSFLYSLTCCMKEVVKGRIFWSLNIEVFAHESATDSYMRIPCNLIQNTDPIVLVLSIALLLNYYIKESI